MDLVAINPERSLFVSGDIDDWPAVRERRIDTIVDMDGKNIKIGIDAPKEISIHREEVFKRIKDENLKAAIGIEFNRGSRDPLL